MGYTEQLFPEGTKRTQGGQARRYNFLAARLIADLVKKFLWSTRAGENIY